MGRPRPTCWRQGRATVQGSVPPDARAARGGEITKGPPLHGFLPPHEGLAGGHTEDPRRRSLHHHNRGDDVAQAIMESSRRWPCGPPSGAGIGFVVGNPRGRRPLGERDLYGFPRRRWGSQARLIRMWAAGVPTGRLRGRAVQHCRGTTLGCRRVALADLRTPGAIRESQPRRRSAGGRPGLSCVRHRHDFRPGPAARAHSFQEIPPLAAVTLRSPTAFDQRRTDTSGVGHRPSPARWGS